MLSCSSPSDVLASSLIIKVYPESISFNAFKACNAMNYPRFTINLRIYVVYPWSVQCKCAVIQQLFTIFTFGIWSLNTNLSYSAHLSVTSINILVLCIYILKLFWWILNCFVVTFALHLAGTSKDSDICDLSKVSDIVILSLRSMRTFFLPLNLYHTLILFQ